MLDLSHKTAYVDQMFADLWNNLAKNESSFMIYSAWMVWNSTNFHCSTHVGVLHI